MNKLNEVLKERREIFERLAAACRRTEKSCKEMSKKLEKSK